MPRATKCRIDGQIVDVLTAIALREQATTRRDQHPDFRCQECGRAVRPHREGATGQQAHFEHIRGNPDCRL